MKRYKKKKKKNKKRFKKMSFFTSSVCVQSRFKQVGLPTTTVHFPHQFIVYLQRNRPNMPLCPKLKKIYTKKEKQSQTF